MSIDLGDVVPLSVAITNAAGVAADATTVTLTVTRPDGTVLTQVLTSDPVGTYGYDFPTTMAGWHAWSIVATGTNACAYSDMFDVQARDARLLVSVPEARAVLDLTNGQTADDEEIRTTLAAVTEVVEKAVGAVIPREYTETHRYAGDTILLYHYPVVSIASVLTYPGPVTVSQAADPTATGWVLSPESGLLARNGGQFGTTTVTYTAGRPVIPPNIREGALVIFAHMWRNTRQGNGRPGLGGTGSLTATPSGYLIPNLAMQLLAPHAQLGGFA